MTPEQLALLAAVRAAPGDDLPRLVYADWLEENVPPADLPCPDCGGDGYGRYYHGRELARRATHPCGECSGRGRLPNPAHARDLATLEFIRLTCPARRTKAGKPWKGPRPDVRLWLRVRWKRLVPALLADEARALAVQPALSRAEGEWVGPRELRTAPAVVLPFSAGPPGWFAYRAYRPRVWLTFDRGFVAGARFRLSGTWEYVLDRLTADQPAAAVTTYYGWSTHVATRLAVSPTSRPPP